MTYLEPEHLVYQDECYTVYSFDDYRNLEQRESNEDEVEKDWEVLVE